MPAPESSYQVIRHLNQASVPFLACVDVFFFIIFIRQHWERYGVSALSSSSSSPPPSSAALSSSNPSSIAARRISQLKIAFSLLSFFAHLFSLFPPFLLSQPFCNVAWRLSATGYVLSKVLFYSILLQRSRIVSLSKSEKGLLALVERLLALATYAGGLIFAATVGGFIEGQSVLNGDVCIIYVPLPFAVVMLLLDVSLSSSFLFLFVLKLRELEAGVRGLLHKGAGEKYVAEKESVYRTSSLPHTAITMEGGEQNNMACSSPTPTADATHEGKLPLFTKKGSSSPLPLAPTASTAASSSSSPFSSPSSSSPAPFLSYSQLMRKNILITAITMLITLVSMLLFVLASTLNEGLLWMVATTGAQTDLMGISICLYKMTAGGGGGAGAGAKKNKVAPTPS